MKDVSIVRQHEDYLIYGARGATYAEVEVEFTGGKFNGGVTYREYEKEHGELITESKLFNSNFFESLKRMATEDYKEIQIVLDK